MTTLMYINSKNTAFNVFSILERPTTEELGTSIFILFLEMLILVYCDPSRKASKVKTYN
jgi:hypothetical protein